MSLRDGAVERLVDGAGCAARRGNAFKKVDDDDISLRSGDVSAFNTDLHGASRKTEVMCRQCSAMATLGVLRQEPRHPMVTVADKEKRGGKCHPSRLGNFSVKPG